MYEVDATVQGLNDYAEPIIGRTISLLATFVSTEHLGTMDTAHDDLYVGLIRTTERPVRAAGLHPGPTESPPSPKLSALTR